MSAPARRRRRLIVTSVLLIVLVVVPIGVGWLLAPLPPAGPGESLLFALPADRYPVAVELRRGRALYGELAADGLWPAPAGQESGPGTDEAAQVRDLVHASPSFWALRALGEQAAAGVADPGGRSGTALVRLDNLSWAGLRAYLWWHEGDLSALLGDALAGGDLHTRFCGRVLVVSTAPAWADEAADLLASGSASSARPEPRPSYPQQGLVLRWAGGQEQPPSWIPATLARDMPGAQVTIERQGGDLRLRVDAQVRSAPLARAHQSAVAGPAGAIERVPPMPELDASDVIGGNVWVAPRLVGGLLTKWEDTSVLRLVAAALMQANVVLGMDGRMGLQVRACPPMQIFSEVPEARGWVGVQHPGQIHTLLYWSALVEVARFREPDGNPLWEAVCGETRLLTANQDDARYTVMRLHQFFFHGMQPYWGHQEDGEALVFGTHFFTQAGAHPAQEDRPAWPQADGAPGRTLVRAAVRWALPHDEIAKWRTLVLDKAIRWAWVDPQAAPAVRAQVAHAEAILRALPPGRARMRLHICPETPEAQSVFCLDIEARAPLKELVAGLTTHGLSRQEVAEVAEWQTR